MARHVLTDEEKRRGLEGALASKATPEHLKAHLRKALKALKGGKASRPKRPAGWLGFFKV